MYMFVFDNPSMESDLTNPNGRVECYKSIACNAKTEEEARTVLNRPKYDQEGKLDPAWILSSTFPLSDRW